MFFCDYLIVMKWKNTRIHTGTDQDNYKSEGNYSQFIQIRFKLKDHSQSLNLFIN